MAKRPDLCNLGNIALSPIREEIGTPGALSVGQQSLGVESSASGYSVSSHCKLLQSGKTEKDVMIETQLQDINKNQSLERECGLWKFRPKCIQCCANIKFFVLCMCFLITTSGMLSTGYLNSVITTIEKRFQIGSSISGLIAASYEFGSLVAVIFISYLGGRRHIPKWIGYGVLFMGFGALLFALPHLIAEKYTVDRGIISNSTEENICRYSDKKQEQCIDKNSGNWIYVLVLITAQVLIGTGGTPIFTLGTTYIDNHVPRDKAPVYLAFVYATGALGPVVGYALGAFFLQIYVDLFSYNVDLSPTHPRWIGAWWGGFIICGCVLLALACPFMSFPQVLVKEKRKVLESKAKEDLFSHEENRSKEGEYGKTVRDIPQSILSLLKNKVYLLNSFGICCEVSIVSGFVVFLPKYIETQFGTSKSEASLFTGGIAIPGAVLGVLFGGFLLKRLKLKPMGAIQLALILDLVALLGCTFFFFLGCDNLKIAGATFPYFNGSGHKILEYEFEANLTSACNMDCDCSNNDLEPICGINGLTYFSPCHAGCTQFYISYTSPEEKTMNFSGCSCILGSHMSEEVIMSPIATSGPCKSTCQNLLPFLILLVVMTFCVAGTHMPLLMVTLRSVREEERCFALGMQFVILRLFAYIPAPIMFGNIIDTACLLWGKTCEIHGSCLVYDIVQFRYKYVGTSAGLKVLGALLFIVVWLYMKHRNRKDAKKQMTVREIMNSITSIDKMDLGHIQPHPYQDGLSSDSEAEQEERENDENAAHPSLFLRTETRESNL
ncbi:hypothetical protein ACJMK2_004386 [Sinanodonta woodiana]|uniref:Solute carrier organic anion transporter family member n=1 Tax=Sinanodonta woodiana TaxID=1069815 RepID=A0ABD3Y2D3_SINWO